MQTIAETRRERLEELIARHGGLIANLNEALGYERNDTRLARIRNANARTDRPGKVFQMGDPQAREIEERLGLTRGWMDTPPGLEYMDNPALRELHRVAQQLAPFQVDQLVSIGTTLARVAEPAAGALDTSQSAASDAGHTAAKAKSSKGLTAVPRVVQKKVGGGLFGPPADGVKGAKRGRSNTTGRGPRKGHVDGDR